MEKATFEQAQQAGLKSRGCYQLDEERRSGTPSNDIWILW
jgi:hypothetical protein